MSATELFAYLLSLILAAVSVAAVGCIVSDRIAAICERKRRKKFRNNYVRFKGGTTNDKNTFRRFSVYEVEYRTEKRQRNRTE